MSYSGWTAIALPVVLVSAEAASQSQAPEAGPPHAFGNRSEARLRYLVNVLDHGTLRLALDEAASEIFLFHGRAGFVALLARFPGYSKRRITCLPDLGPRSNLACRVLQHLGELRARGDDITEFLELIEARLNQRSVEADLIRRVVDDLSQPAQPPPPPASWAETFPPSYVELHELPDEVAKTLSRAESPEELCRRVVRGMLDGDIEPAPRLLQGLVSPRVRDEVRAIAERFPRAWPWRNLRAQAGDATVLDTVTDDEPHAEYGRFCLALEMPQVPRARDCLLRACEQEACHAERFEVYVRSRVIQALAHTGDVASCDVAIRAMEQCLDGGHNEEFDQLFRAFDQSTGSLMAAPADPLLGGNTEDRKAKLQRAREFRSAHAASSLVQIQFEGLCAQSLLLAEQRAQTLNPLLTRFVRHTSYAHTRASQVRLVWSLVDAMEKAGLRVRVPAAFPRIP